jgi:hypothetical protein
MDVSDVSDVRELQERLIFVTLDALVTIVTIVTIVIRVSSSFFFYILNDILGHYSDASFFRIVKIIMIRGIKYHTP